MARTVVSAQNTSANSGINPLSYEAANVDGNSVVNNGRRIAVVVNNDTAAHTVTQITGGTASGLDVTDPTVSIAAGDTAILGPWPPIYHQPDSNEVWLDYDAVTSVDIAVVEV